MMVHGAQAVGRASGKVILCGEHAVVYGTRAIAAPIPRGAHAVALADGEGTLELGDKRVRIADGSQEAAAFAELGRSLGLEHCSAKVSIEVPPGIGLGASAAAGVALARALGALRNAPLSEAEVLAAALGWERVFHGNPSGIDTTTVASTGCICFKKGSPAEPIKLPEPCRLLIAITPRASSTQSGAGGSSETEPASSATTPKTKVMVEFVARFADSHPGRFRDILRAIDELGAGAAAALGRADWAQLGRSMNVNQELLRELGVSSPLLDEACALAREAGAWGAKLTGAGGGGAAIAVAPPSSEQRVLRAWADAGIESLSTSIGSGV